MRKKEKKYNSIEKKIPRGLLFENKIILSFSKKKSENILRLVRRRRRRSYRGFVYGTNILHDTGP